MKTPLASLLLLAVMVAAGPDAGASETPATETAQYRVTFDPTWSSTTHPGMFPGGAHFSGLVGGTHDDTVGFWEAGGQASNGIEAMAELGVQSTFASEVQAAVGAGSAAATIVGSNTFIVSPSGITSEVFTISQDHPLVTLVSMIAPSPDWFVGVDGLSLFENGDWVGTLSVDLLPWDAGTDSGCCYTSANANTNPQDPITLITSGPVGNGVPLGTFLFERLDAPDPWGDLGAGLAGTNGTPQLVGSGTLEPLAPVTLTLTDGLPFGSAFLVIGFTNLSAPFKQGTLVPQPLIILAGLPLDGSGDLEIVFPWFEGAPNNFNSYYQYWIPDAGGPANFAASNAVCGTTP